MDFSDFVHGGDWYFIGIGGVSMSALARILHRRGVRVRGSDRAENEFTKQLRACGIPVTIGAEEEITEPNVAYTGAVDETHPQLAGAIRAGKRLYPRAELLGRVAEEFPCVLSVAGCHGKTSTTSMLSHIFSENKRAFSCHIGGEDIGLGNCYSGGDEFFVTEACEFRRSFLSLKSTVAVILNTDRDHTDCYHDDEETFSAYRAFAERAEMVVVNAEERSRKIKHALSFGIHTGDICAADLRSDGEKYAFTVVEKGLSTVRIKLDVVGKFQVQNALACYAAARLCGFSSNEIKRGLESFRGVRRRFEQIGTLYGAPVICDYAHHPKEIEAVYRTACRLCDGTVRVVFQPHTFTRTRDLMREFRRALLPAENPVIYQTYSAREPYIQEGSAVALTSKLPEAVYVQSPAQLQKRLTEFLQNGDLVLVLGAGDIYETAKSIIDVSPTDSTRGVTPK